MRVGVMIVLAVFALEQVYGCVKTIWFYLSMWSEVLAK